MSLKDLIVEMDRSESAPILVNDIAAFIHERGFCDDIAFIPSDMDNRKVKGFIRPFEYSSGPYGEPIRAANIYYSKELNDCWRRYVCAKELTHLLDSRAVAVDNVEKLEGLMIGLTSSIAPSRIDPEKMPIACLADVMAEAFVLPVLVPPTLRDLAVESLREGKMSHHDIAHLFRIPRKFVPFIVSDMYTDLVNLLLVPPSVT